MTTTTIGEPEAMRHIQPRTAMRPVRAQLESVLQLISVLQSLLALYQNLNAEFKEEEA